MLVLSRKIGERILVPHCELAITVLATAGSRATLQRSNHS
jgi:sRNA-binding carbon storage regulator CsrA